jgi:hypothetical protein
MLDPFILSEKFVSGEEGSGAFPDGGFNLTLEKHGSERQRSENIDFIRLHYQTSGNGKPHGREAERPHCTSPILLHIADFVGKLIFDFAEQSLDALQRFFNR